MCLHSAVTRLYDKVDSSSWSIVMIRPCVVFVTTQIRVAVTALSTRGTAQSGLWCEIGSIGHDLKLRLLVLVLE